MVIAGSSPTLYLRDSDERTGMIHMNSNRIYFLSGVANSDAWTQINGVWPLYLETHTNAAVFGGTVTAPTFSGALSGNATSASTAGSCSGNSATASSAATLSSQATIIRAIPYSNSYASGYNTAALEIREYNLEGAAGGTEWARAPRIGFHWGSRVASQLLLESSGAISCVNNPGNAYEEFKCAKLHIYEASGTGADPTGGSVVIRHGNSYGTSSICFPSAVNYTSDYGWIQYQDRRHANEDLRFSIGTSNDADDHLILYPSGLVGVKTWDPGYTLDVNGSLRCSGTPNTGSDDRIKYHEEEINNPLELIKQLTPYKYEKISGAPNKSYGNWIPKDDEWDSVKHKYEWDTEAGLIAQHVRRIPELAYLVKGEESTMRVTRLTIQEHENLAEDRKVEFTPFYGREEVIDGYEHIEGKQIITVEEYNGLELEKKNEYDAIMIEKEVLMDYFVECETETILSLDYNGIHCVSIGAIQELDVRLEIEKTKVATLETQLQANQAKVATLEDLVMTLLTRVQKLEQR